MSRLVSGVSTCNGGHSSSDRASNSMVDGGRLTMLVYILAMRLCANNCSRLRLRVISLISVYKVSVDAPLDAPKHMRNPFASIGFSIFNTNENVGPRTWHP